MTRKFHSIKFLSNHMQTKNIVQASCNVIRITNLRKGDTVKRIEEQTYGGAKVQYGVVVDLLNNGDRTFIQLMEYEKNYSSVTCAVKIISDKDDVALFPVEPDEVREYLDEAIVNMEAQVKTKQDEVSKLQEGVAKAKEFVSGETARQLTMAAFKELPQGEFEEKKRLMIEAQKEAAEVSF